MIEYDPQSRKIYVGYCSSEKLKDGKGVSAIISGQNRGHCYEGMFRQGLYHGHGFYRWPNGDTYTGMFEDGMKHGLGTWHKHAQVYTGHFKQDKRHGLGL